MWFIETEYRKANIVLIIIINKYIKDHLLKGRTKKPLEFYLEKYGTSFFGLNKMYLLMEKQHNRGQDGAGLVNIKLDMEPGKRYISRYRSVDAKPIQDCPSGLLPLTANR